MPHTLRFKYGQSLQPRRYRNETEEGRAYWLEQDRILAAFKVAASKVCPNSTDGKHRMDDGRCLFCDLDLEYTMEQV